MAKLFFTLCRLGGAVVLAGLLSFAAHAAPDGRLLFKSAHFEVRYHPKSAVAAQPAMAAAEPSYQRIVELLGKAPEAPIYVDIAHGGEEFRARAGEHAPEWAAGFAYPAENRILLRVEGAGTENPADELARVLRHEIAHIALHGAMAPNHPPRWLSEGFAMYIAEEWTLGRIASLARAVATGGLLPLERLSRGFPAGAASADVAYAQSIGLVTHIIEEHGEIAFQQFVRDLTAGRTLDEAVQRLSGMNLAEFEAAWHDSLRLTYNWIPLATGSTTLWFGIAMLFLAAYRRKRREMGLRLREMRLQEELELLEAAQGTLLDASAPAFRIPVLGPRAGHEPPDQWIH